MNAIPLPKSLTKELDEKARAVFVLEPLYPGYGTTIGNALRRVLLSSLQGAALTSVKFEGVTHEFSTLPFVKEDVVDILLNLKQVRLRIHGDEPVTLTLKAKGDGVVTAGDIEKNAGVTVVNKDQVIATLTDKAAIFELELTAAKGRGYVPVENREKEKLPIGTIALDAIYTPVKNVNFTTEHVRVEQMTNYDKLKLDITTDGTLTPDEALHQATNIMVEHFTYLLGNIVPTPPADETGDEAPKKKSRKKKADLAETAETPAEPEPSTDEVA